MLPHKRLLTHIARKLMFKHKQDTEDIIQSVYLKAWRNFDRFNPELSSPKTWLVMILENLWKESIQNKKAIKRTGFNVPIESAMHVPQKVQFYEEMFSDEMQKAIDNLPMKYKPVLLTMIDENSGQLYTD